MAAAPAMRQIRVASYNIHAWRGTDGQHAPERIMDVIDSLQADILALQEVVSPQRMGLPCSMADMASEHDYHVTFGPTMLREDSQYGNALLSRREPTGVHRHDISVPGREPRGAVEAFFSYGDLTLKVICTHLGLRQRERASQLDALLSIATTENADATIVMGDFNNWFGLSREHRLLRRQFGPQPAVRTFPSYFPLFGLDKILISPGSMRTSLAAVNTPVARKASDHLPILSTLEIR